MTHYNSVDLTHFQFLRSTNNIRGGLIFLEFFLFCLGLFHVYLRFIGTGRFMAQAKQNVSRLTLGQILGLGFDPSHP